MAAFYEPKVSGRVGTVERKKPATVKAEKSANIIRRDSVKAARDEKKRYKLIIILYILLLYNLVF